MKLKKLIAWSSFWYNMQILNFYWSFSIKRSPSSNNIFAIIFKWTNNFSLIAPAFITFIRSDENFSIVSILALKFATIWWSCGALLSFQIQTTFFCNGRVSTCYQTIITSTIVAAIFDTCSEINGKNKIHIPILIWT